ncbi:angiotensin-converting enzyme-like [Tachypleus tridentatus]|uniref:angiotensin-converting enzyme-like n=1 Tax=Tachypleus tridentatus TaxID=6853 RepID=UPI003FD3C5A5
MERIKLSLVLLGVANIVGLFVYVESRPQYNLPHENEKLARIYMTDLDTKFSQVLEATVNAQWIYNTNITDYNLEKMVEESQKYYKFQKTAWKDTILFKWEGFKDEFLKRQFKKLSVLGTAALEDDKLEKLSLLEAEMERTYSTATVCIRDKCNLALEPDLTRILASSRDYEELKEVWLKWRDAAGKPIRNQYIEVTKLGNEAAKANGFSDLSEMWLEPYESETFRDDVENLWNELRPLYQKIHAYVRMKLRETYGDKMPKDGTIPAHLLGNMWAQTWTSLLEDLKPFDKPSIDVTKKMQELKWDAEKMFKVSEEFFTSLGLIPMPPEFWEHSMLTKPKDRDVVCHASAWDFYNGKDFRIKQCTDVTTEQLITVHHEMGHVEYFLQYKNQPVVFRDGANPGFHEALGDVMSLSVSTPKHLHEIGLLDELVEDEETDINFLLAMALKKIVFLPFGYLMDLWRWDVFSGNTAYDNMNKKWWELRIKYQGISPPSKRSEVDFDAGAKYHIPSGVPYIRYFVSFVIQFQFHEALCKKAGHQGPLYKCDIYRNKKAGNALSEALSIGSSRLWPEVMELLTGESTMNGKSLISYFEPLETWLDSQLKDESIGWPYAKLEDYLET